ncbi:Poly [ADP-ribose] polymerase 6 [Ataeniobius toweri]|uniref:Poly [ADP-ribose] polymerase n=2 Tax=Goodeidae TaxID=28758 RepID=A0ABU7CEE3_9TELE|nr:Poly [ADP-ribose] polymerase 6 [Ataeniobius toweri]
MEAEWQQWAESCSDEDSDSEDFVSGIQCLSQQERCATDLYHHRQLDTDMAAVRTLYSDAAVSVREYPSIDAVDVELNITTNIVDVEVAKAWRINPTEPIIIRLHFTPSLYLDGPAPSVEVFQPSNTDDFSIGRQLQNILTVFISQEWKHLTNNSPVVQRKSGHSWFRPSGTIKKFSARFSVWLPPSKTNEIHQPADKDRNRMKQNHFAGQTTSYNIRNPTGELFTYTAGGKRVMVSAVKSSAHLSTKQLMELLFTSQAIRHCKSTPTLQHGFLAQIIRYAEQRIPTMNEYCVVCDERHVFQNGPMLKTAVCTRELCVFSFHTLGVMSGATEEVATGAEVIDLLVAMCRAALRSSRKSIIFEPYPSVVDPCNPKTLAFSPKRKSYERLQKALDGVLLIRRMAQGPYSEIKKQMDKIDPLAHPLLQWILASNRSHIVKLPLNKQLRFMRTTHQFLLVSAPPSKEIRFQTARKLYGSTFAFHGSHIENWHSILRKGLVSASYTKLQLHGAAYGKGIYLSPISSISFGYSDMGKGQHQIPTREELISKYNQIHKMKQEEPGQPRFLQSHNLNCVALCEVITSKALQKRGNVWVCPVSDHVCTRFLFVYENGQFVSSSPLPEMTTFRRISRSEERVPFPIPGLAADILHMRVKEGSKIRNLLRFATARMQGKEEDGSVPAVRQVVFTGLGRGITKTITCVEILKRKVEGLHQVSKLCYMTVNEVWESPQQEVAGITVERTVPAICILLSKDPLDPQELGYQPPQTFSVPTEEEERRGELLRTAGSPSSLLTAKRLCLDDWTGRPPKT